MRVSGSLGEGTGTRTCPTFEVKRYRQDLAIHAIGDASMAGDDRSEILA
jgi:hypothetical protein